MVLNMQMDTFMLRGNTAKELYDSYAKDAPIYDYHCHLSAKEIYEDEVFENIASVWLKFDHYKWRAMRYAGISEKYVTGNADAADKFRAFARTLERLVGCPLYHWANMELQTYFGIKELLKESNADIIYKTCNEKIQKDSLSPVTMIKASGVKLICTTDDPADSLEYHKMLRAKPDLDFKVLPTFRPDKALNIRNLDFTVYVGRLSEVSKIPVKTYEDFLRVLKERLRFFQEAGCILSDHSLETLVYEPTSEEETAELFKKRMDGRILTVAEAEKFKIHTLTLLAAEYRKLGWVMQLHIGACRNINRRSFEKLGVDAGFDIMNDYNLADPLIGLLNGMELGGGLPKTILYTLNSKDNLLLSSIPHCFTEAGIPGKVQFGPAWWFNDNKDGILNHLEAIAAQGMLADFTGMLTDSRSFLSYVRHDYFRRILCSFIGELIDAGEYERDDVLLKQLIEGICYINIRDYLNLKD